MVRAATAADRAAVVERDGALAGVLTYALGDEGLEVVTVGAVRRGGCGR